MAARPNAARCGMPTFPTRPRCSKRSCGARQPGASRRPFVRRRGGARRRAQERVPLLSLADHRGAGAGAAAARGRAPSLSRLPGHDRRLFRRLPGRRATAIEPMIDFYGGAGTFAGWPKGPRLCGRDDAGQYPRLGGRLRFPADARLSREGRRPDPGLARRGQPSGDAAANELLSQCHGQRLARDDRRRGPFHDFDPCRGGRRGDHPASGRRGTRRKTITSSLGAPAIGTGFRGPCGRSPDSREWRCRARLLGRTGNDALINVVRGLLCGALLFATGAARAQDRLHPVGLREVEFQDAGRTVALFLFYPGRAAAAGPSPCRSSPT